MRAVSFNLDAAKLMGINTDRIIAFTFGLGSALAGAGGILVSLMYPKIDPLMGILPGLKAFVAAVLGGIGNITGAMFGGLIIGLAEVMAVDPAKISFDDESFRVAGSNAAPTMLDVAEWAREKGRSDLLGSVGDAYKSVRRYYANSFSDQGKQGAINLFLGRFRPRRHRRVAAAQAPGARLLSDYFECGAEWAGAAAISGDAQESRSEAGADSVIVLGKIKITFFVNVL